MKFDEHILDGRLLSDLVFGDLGLEIIKFFQSFSSPFLDTIFLVITSLGNAFFYILIVSLVYWLHSKKIAIHMASMLVISSFISDLIKNFFGWPRPYVSHPDQVKAISTESSYSFTSGHSISTGTFWPSLYYYFKESEYNLGLLILSIVFLILVPISRLYLGVHYPSDVIFGVLLGFLVVFLYIRFSPTIFDKTKDLSLTNLTILVLVSGCIMILLDFSVIALTGHDQNIEDAGQMGAIFTGALLGFLLEQKFINFPNPERKLFYITRPIIGIILIAAGYLLPTLILGSDQLEMTIIRHITRYFLIGLIASFLTPYIFTKMENTISKR